MDELVHHCLRELAFDGDLGCHPSRLRDFVISYCQGPHEQVVDDAYFAFVWSLVVCQPTVRVGTVPHGATTEVYVAPQQSQKRKSKEKDEGCDASPSVTSLALLPDARSRTFEDLQSQYGEALRIAVDAKTSLAAIIGSHIRPPKLTPMVYTALQFITRGREHGISTVDLGKKTGYDQKTCFYLIKQLLELELVVKLRRGGVGTNFCIHKYFFDRSPLWRQIQDEGGKDPDEGGPDNGEIASTQDGSQAPVQFDPIDARHLSSLSLIQSRIVKLLKHSESQTHPSQNLLVTIGFLNPTKTDRRFFQSRLRELIENDVVERVMVPSAVKGGSASVPCIRLSSNSNDVGNESSELPTPITRDPPTRGAPDEHYLHKQMIDLLENAGTKGMTLNEISRELGNFDRRTLELLLTKLEKVPPPTHLNDLRIVQLMETHGRERRWRYFTFSSYRQIIAKEKLDDKDSPYSSVDLSSVGDFAPCAAEDFYSDQIGKIEDIGVEATPERAKTTVRKNKRKRGEAGLGADADGEIDHAPPKKRGRPRKHPAEGQHIRTTATEKDATGTHDVGGNLRSCQTGGTGITNDRHSPSPRVPRKRRRPPDDTHKDEFVPEALISPRRRGWPRKRLPSPSPAHVTVEHSPSRNDVHHSDHPQSEPQAEAPFLSKEYDVTLQSLSHRELSTQPELPSSGLPDHHPLCGSGTAMGIVEDNRLNLAQHDHPSAGPQEMRSKPLGVPDSEGGIMVQMDTSSRLSVDHTLLDNALPQLQDGSKPAEVERVRAVSVPRKQKEKAATPHSRSNVSLLRRENEFLRILQESGGVVHPSSKEFLDAHMALLDTLASAGESTSGLPGIKVDKRTIENTFESLENRGKVKVLKTAISTVTGAQRPARIIYLPTVDQSKLDTFLVELGRAPHGAPYSVINPSAASVPPGVLKAKKPAQPLRVLQSERGVDNIGHWSKSIDDQIVHDVLLTERTTVAQLYGFFPGKMVRARELHLATLDIFESCHDTSTAALAAQRVVNFSQYFRDFPVGVYCSLVSTLVQSDELSQILSTEEGRRTPVKDLPQSLQTLLQIGRSRSRERLLELLEILLHLNLVTPLQPSDSPNALIRCEPKGDGPSSFETFAGDMSSTSYRTAPDYWLFYREATLHLWALSTASPPFWKSVSVSTRLDASNYWDELQPACESKTFSQTVTQGNPPRAISSWNRLYDLSWHQRQYLKRFISRRRDDTPLQDEESDFTLEKISWTISAPLSVVKDFIQKERTSQLRELDRARLPTPGGEGDGRHAERMAQEKELLTQKVADAKMRKEREWEAILNAVHPGPLEGVAATRVARVRKRYLQSGVASDRSRWEGEVRDAIRDFRGAAKAVLPSAQRVVPAGTLRGATVAPSLPAGLPQASIEELIAEQGPAREEAKGKKSKQEEKKDESRRWEPDDDDPSQRRSRFFRSREVGGRMDWFAFRQIFPAVPRNSVRQRIASLREMQNNEVYMRRLEEQWYRLWKQYGGTEHLPDPNPQSQTDFDLIKHLGFLRKFVDKNALLGFLWDSKVDENREKGLLQTAFTTNHDEIPTFGDGGDGSSGNQEVQVAEAALKMVFGTPNEHYAPLRGASLLRSVGKGMVSRAKENLLSRGVLSKLVRDQKPKPGRTLKISEINQNAFGGSIQQEVFHDAATLDALSKQEESWREWPLRASDGDLAMLAQSTSEGLVDFRLDISGARAARDEVDWNSKKADGNFHTLSSILPSDTEDALASRVRSPSAEEDDVEGHGRTTGGTVACCRKYSDGQVNCDLCLNSALKTWALQSDTKEQEVAHRILDMLDEAALQALTLTVGDGSELVLSALTSLMDSTVPLVAPWTVTISEEPRINVLPRRWLDVRGAKIREVWRAALRAVIGTVVFRPGISQAEIVWRLRSVYDRAEVIEALRQLHEDGFVRRRLGANKPVRELGLVPVREEDERAVHWLLGNRRWYQASLE
ncbi:hypothetical protein BC826DRAFT_977421 [Russula brevipes]|nr:hypothetical protein BC826DRAFT_977421 [Russula brevipes]